MSLPPVGTRMMRVEDGVLGRVELMSEEPRIVFYDRGTMVVASKLEKWALADVSRGKLRDEEIRAVAVAADREVRCIERNEPRKFWEPLRIVDPIYDQGLINVITEYLEARG
jgi:hypothetical protein